MDPIEKIDIQQVTIPQLDGRSWMYQVPAVPNNDPPITIELGFPIVELPGCVAVSYTHLTLPTICSV